MPSMLAKTVNNNNPHRMMPRGRAAIADPTIRHRVYKNGTDVSKITSDVDPGNWHVVAQDRTTWKLTMHMIDVLSRPTPLTTRT